MARAACTVLPRLNPQHGVIMQDLAVGSTDILPETKEEGEHQGDNPGSGVNGVLYYI